MKISKWAGMVLILSLATVVWAKPNRVVVGYSASWFDGLYPAESYNYDAFTHICRAFLIPKPNGDIAVSGDYWNQDLEKMAHAKGVKVLASIGGAAQNADHWLSMARNPAYQKHFFDELEKLITANHYDGVDIDWEPSALTDPDQATYTKFMQDLRVRFPKWIITTALGGGDWWAKHVSWAEIAKQVDFVNLMTYDFSGAWTGHSGHNANLYTPSDPKVDSGLSIDEMVNRLENRYALPADKIVLGLPFYGTQFFTGKMGDNFTDEASKTVIQIQYYETAPLLSGKEYKALWDDGAKVPYLEKVGGGHIVSYDDPKSIAIKCEYAAKKDLKGVMIWNLGADVVGDRTPLLDAICKAYNAPARPMPASGLAKSLATFAGMVNEARGRLLSSYNKLVAAGKTEEAKMADPFGAPDLVFLDTKDAGKLGKTLWKFQYQLSAYNRKLEDSQKAVNSIPVPKVEGKKLVAKAAKTLVDDFESGGTVNAFRGNWMTDCDHNNLGTVMNPMPFNPATGGSSATPKKAAHIWGHLGKSQSPWPYAMLTGTLDPGSAAVDLSGFKGILFSTKGNGKDYSVVLARAAVQDYCNFRQDFKTSAEWRTISLPLDKFKQPDWGRQVPIAFTDVMYMAFTVSAAFSDEDFDLWVDDVTLVK